jgi:hypothetical protein
MSPVPPATSRSRQGRSFFGGRSFETSASFQTAMHAARHQVVHQVVAPRDGVEHAVDKALLVVERHVAEAEMGVLVHDGGP